MAGWEVSVEVALGDGIAGVGAMAARGRVISAMERHCGGDLKEHL